MKYRADIDGLRALAVVSIILFHAKFKIFSGGFVGVDIFFVISGYLITTIILRDIQGNRFSIVNFYERRARRILPALLCMLTFTYIISSIIFLPAAHKVVGQYIVSSIFSGTNILLYLKRSEYFGLENGNNPLFHTWSLGVEEQFYIIFPFLLLVIYRFAKQKLFWFIATITLLSFYLSEIEWRNDATANFYLLHTRSWELLVGSLTAFLINKKGVQKSNLLAFIGLASIVFSILTFDESTPVPSVYALIPIIGVVLVILYADKETIVSRILSYKVFVGIGLISYSAYLWHLPLKIFNDYLFEKSLVTLFGYFVLLITISSLSYFLIEKPFRRILKRKIVFTIISVFVISLSVFGVYGHINGGYPERLEIFSQLKLNNGWGLACNGNTSISDACSNSSNPKISILGNSYAMTWVNPIVSSTSKGVVQLTKDSCAIGFIDEVSDINSIPCDEFYENVVKKILETKSIETVVISSPFGREFSSSNFKKSFFTLLNKLKYKKIIVIGPTPGAPFNVGECLLKNKLFNIDKSCDFELPSEHKLQVQEIADLVLNLENTSFIDITGIICPYDFCSMQPKENVLMYTDAGHLSLSGAEYVYSKLDISL